MTKKHIWVVVAYICGQLVIPFVIAIGAAILSELHSEGAVTFEFSQELTLALAVAVGSVVTLIATILLMKDDIRQDVSERGWLTKNQLTTAILGAFLLFFAQALAVYIESIFGITSSSENTKDITDMIKNYPALFLFPALYAPVLEEIIFRKFLMGGLKQRFGFWPAILISSLVFGLVHLEFTHLLIYSSLGFVLGYLYHKTDKIAVPMLAHGIMNASVVVIQLFVA